MNTTASSPDGPSDEELQKLLDFYMSHREEFELFRKQVADFFLISRRLMSTRCLWFIQLRLESRTPNTCAIRLKESGEMVL